jgi:YidC/Oxa1 family membrane protein insertase
MEKNTFLAIGLSIAIMLVWSVLFPPPKAPPPAENVAQEETLPDEEQAIVEGTTRAVTSALAPVQSNQPSKSVLIETPKYRLTLNTRGGIAESMLLKEYQHNKPRLTLSTWVPYLTPFLGAANDEVVTEDNLVNMMANDLEDIRHFSVEFEGEAALTQGLEQSVFSVSQDDLQLQEGSATLQFVSPVVDGVQLIKTYEFYADSFLVGYRVQVINRREEVQTLRVRHIFGEGRVPNSDYQQQGAHTGPIYYFDGEVETEDAEDVLQEFQIANVDWFGLEDQYFINAVASETPIKLAYFQSQNAFIDGENVPRAYFGARLPIVNLQPNLQIESRFQAYFGPKADSEMLTFGRNLTESHNMTLGALAEPLLALLRWLHGHVGNYGVAIIFLTIIVRLLLFPLTYKGMKGMKRMQQLAPKLKKLQERHKDNKEKLNQEMMALYRKNKVNPVGGCLPLLLQIPVFIALYSALSSAVELRHAPFIFWLDDLSSPDGLGITPILMGVSLYFQQKLTPTAATMDPMQVKIMQYLPLVFTIFTFTFPSGLTLYWFTSNLLSIAQQKILNSIKTPELQD